MPKERVNNVVQIFGKGTGETIRDQIDLTLRLAIEDNDDYPMVNCMIIMIEADGTLTYSYSNDNKNVTMIGALDIVKNLFMKDVEIMEKDD